MSLTDKNDCFPTNPSGTLIKACYLDVDQSLSICARCFDGSCEHNPSAQRRNRRVGEKEKTGNPARKRRRTTRTLPAMSATGV